MTWCEIEGHDAIVERFRRSLQRRRFGSSYLFLGPPGVGKRRFGLRLAQALLCDRQPETELAPCLECPPCQQVAAEAHPDVDLISRPDGKKTIPVELFIGDREHRMREGLCHHISLKPSSGRRRVAIIDDADYLSKEAANCLLKTLEEPPPGSVLILIGTSELRQLPTIRSRCQIVRFEPLPDAFVRQYVQEQGWVEKEDQIADVVELAGGSLDRAREFADPELAEFMHGVNDRWSRSPINSVGLSQRIREFVDAAGSEAATKRIRLRQVVLLRMRHIRRAMGAALEDADQETGGRSLEAESLAGQLDRCVVAFDQIDASANLATLITCWVDDLCEAGVSSI